MRATNAFILSSLRSHSLSRRPCSLAIVLHARSHGLAQVHVGMHGMAWTLNHRKIFECADLNLR